MKNKKFVKTFAALAALFSMTVLAGCTPANPYADDPRYAIYQLAVGEGYTGTYQEWLDSIKGEDGKDGKDGVDGKDGKDGVDGKDGKNGTNGKDGKDGKDGTSLLTGEGAPDASLGKDGDAYIDLSTWDYYVKKVVYGWVFQSNLMGIEKQSLEEQYWSSTNYTMTIAFSNDTGIVVKVTEEGILIGNAGYWFYGGTACQVYQDTTTGEKFIYVNDSMMQYVNNLSEDALKDMYTFGNEYKGSTHNVSDNLYYTGKGASGSDKLLRALVNICHGSSTADSVEALYPNATVVYFASSTSLSAYVASSFDPDTTNVTYSAFITMSNIGTTSLGFEPVYRYDGISPRE